MSAIGWRKAAVAAAGMLTIAAGAATPVFTEAQMRAAMVTRPNQQLIRFANAVPCYYVADLAPGKAPVGSISRRWTGSCPYGVANGEGTVDGTTRGYPEHMHYGARYPYRSIGQGSRYEVFPKPGIELVMTDYEFRYIGNIYSSLERSSSILRRDHQIRFNTEYFNYRDFERDISSTLDMSALPCSKNRQLIVSLNLIDRREIKIRDETLKNCEKWVAKPREISNGFNFSYVEPDFYLLRIDIHPEHGGTAMRVVKLCDGKDTKDPCFALIDQANALLAPLVAQTSQDIKAALTQFNTDAALRGRRMNALIAAHKAGEATRLADQQAAVDQQDSAAFGSMSVGELYAHADELNRKGEYDRARKAFRALIRRFPDHALATEAAKRL